MVAQIQIFVDDHDGVGVVCGRDLQLSEWGSVDAFVKVLLVSGVEL